LVGELEDTRRFDPPAPSSAAAQPGSRELTNRLYVPPPAAYHSAPGLSPLYQTGSVRKSLVWWKIGLLIAILMAFTFMAVGIKVGIDRRRARRESTEMARRSFQNVVQNALGLKLGSFSASDFPDVHGVFVDSLMSDDSPAAVAKIQAGDVLMELNQQPVRNSPELVEVLNSIKPGTEVPVKLYRDGETLTLRIKVADPSIAPPLLKTSTREQGFLGVEGIGNRRRIPGTKKWGVEIRRPTANGPADLAGLQSGDLITEFDGHAIRTAEEFRRRLQATQPRSKVAVKFYRGNTEQAVEVTVGHRN
jgi:S1-C subfamily serine protease